MKQQRTISWTCLSWLTIVSVSVVKVSSFTGPATTHHNLPFLCVRTQQVRIPRNMRRMTRASSMNPPEKEKKKESPPTRKTTTVTKTNATTGPKGFASGFGSSPNKSSSDSITTTNTNNASSNTQSTKTRSVSGNARGSGTKILRNAANTFDEIRQRYGKESTTDLYLRSPLHDPHLFWFVGKVARRLQQDAQEDPNRKGTSLPTPTEAVLSQKRIILEYAKSELRPQNFAGPYSNHLELWMAPGDSELDVVQNKVILQKVIGNASSHSFSDGFHVQDVGFNPEIYVGEEVLQGGLRVKRDEHGYPLQGVFELKTPANRNVSSDIGAFIPKDDTIRRENVA